eukprot:scaffold22607_cov123-Cylindrotheca_fusiformis.AAC.30
MPESWPNVIVKEPHVEDATFCDTLWACLLDDYEHEDDQSTVFTDPSAIEKYVPVAKRKSSRGKKPKVPIRRPRKEDREVDSDSGGEEGSNVDPTDHRREQAPTVAQTRRKKSSDRVEAEKEAHDRQIPSDPSDTVEPPSRPVKSTTDPEDASEIRRMREESKNRGRSGERELPIQKSRKKLALENEKSQRKTRTPSRSSGDPSKERSKKIKGTARAEDSKGSPRQTERRPKSSKIPTEEKKKMSKTQRASRTTDPILREESGDVPRAKRAVTPVIEKEQSQRSIRESSNSAPAEAHVSASQFSSIEEYQNNVLESRRRAERKLALKRIREIKAKMGTKEDP